MDETAPGVRRIARIGLVVPDLPKARAFYEQALGFRTISDGGALAVLQLGAQQIELTPSGPEGQPYPEPRAANDPCFQHFAIVVSDMPAAYAQLSRYAQAPISQGGPQRLPPSTGSVTAYKFRDPDGHPLELSHIPGGSWAKSSADGPFLGLDHTALAVRDLDASIAFYTDGLGFALGGRFLNQGPEQDRLDGLPEVQLDIVVLTTAEPGPHIELLHYRRPTSAEAPITPQPGDIADSRTIVEASDLAPIVMRLARANIPWTARGGDLFLRDPDGHGVEIRVRPPA